MAWWWWWGVNNMPQPLYFQERDLEPIIQEAGWAPGPVSRAVEISPPPGFDPWTVHPVTTDYTDYAIPAHFSVRYKLNFYIQCRLLLVFERLNIIILSTSLTLSQQLSTCISHLPDVCYEPCWPHPPRFDRPH